MPKTVVAMFDSFDQAQSAVQDLMNFGVRREDISLVRRDEQGQITDAHEVGSSGAAEGAGAGAVGGTVVGGALGLLIGAGLLVIPGIGPVLAAGPLAAAVGSAAATIGATALGAGLGAAAGGLLGGLMGAGISEEDAQIYMEGVRRGGTLVSVGAADSEADEISQILMRNSAIDIDERAASWRSAGWGDPVAEGSRATPIDSTSDAYTADAAPGIPRGDSYSVRSRDYNAGVDTVGAQSAAETDAAGKDWQDSSKLGTVGGSLAGAATGAAAGAIGGPVGSVVGGIAGAVAGAGVGAAGDVAGERAEPAIDRAAERSRGPGNYDFRDDEDLNRVDRQVVDSSYTDVDRTGERVKGPEGYATGHSQPFEGNPAQFDEFVRSDEGNFRTAENTMSGTGRQASDGDTLSESTRRAPHFAGSAGTEGQLASDRLATMGNESRRGPRIYDRPDRNDRSASAADAATPAHGDFARGMREEPAPAVEPDYARGQDGSSGVGAHTDSDPAMPHHGDFARGMREEAEPVQPDYARGQRGYEVYDADFVTHYQSMTGAGGQPYDYYKPGYQFGYDMANDKSFSHDSWDVAERDARQRWEQEARGSWEEFKQTIRYGWEKARGRA